MQIKVDDLSGGEIIGLMQEHLADMYVTSPAESVHALKLDELKAHDITFFGAWIDGSLAGCIALKHLEQTSAEVKSMRTAKGFRNKGVASNLLEFAMEFARERGYTSLSLETGTQDYFDAARKLYLKYGFVECAPFANYKLDPNSYFMTISLG